MTQQRFRLDPSCFPQRLDLDLSEDTLVALERLSCNTGRPVRELAEHLLAQALTQQQRPP